MSSPIVWIIFPLLVALIAFLFRRWVKVITISAIFITVALAWLAWQAPIGELIQVGPLSFTIEERLTFLGRRFELQPSDASALVLIYLGVAFWFGGSIIAKVRQVFVSAGMAIAALLTAAIAVEPFLYAALLIELAVFLCVALLVEPGRQVASGAIRFLTLQTLGIPFILFAGWLLVGVEASPEDSDLVLQASLMLAFGFAFLMAIFPFHTWIPMLAEEAHPYTAAFVFFLLPTAITLFGLGFLDRYNWLRNQPDIYQLIQLAGLLMVLVGGLFSAFQNHLGRIMGFAVILEIGLTLLAVSAVVKQPADRSMLEIMFIQILPRGVELGVWSLSLVVLSRYDQNQEGRGEQLRFRNIHGLARSLPIAALCLVVAQLSLVGFPLLAGFPAHRVLWLGLVPDSPNIALLALLGNSGMLFASLRTMAVLVMGTDEPGWRITENLSQTLLLATGGFIIVLIGMFPQWFLPLMIRMAELFPNLGF
ncbi:MAG TPA: proton-conducting transporter membrane subunit [Anaerolineales bacterium]|nr:proton-conducting transporter membrane subunit [Anaerolineales bacterium]